MSSDLKKRSRKDKKDRSEKKRRRSTDKPSTSSSPSKTTTTTTTTTSKKVKFENKTPKAKPIVTSSLPLKVEVQPQNSAKDPIVVSFPSGLPPSLDNNPNSSPPIFTWSKSRHGVNRGRALLGADDTCAYTASNEGRGHDGRLTKFYIAIYHKPSKTVRFIPAAERGHVYAMNQSVSSYHDSKTLDFKDMTPMERRRLVYESFGSSKKKKVLKSQDANVVKMESVVGAGDGMMKAIGKQMDGEGLVSESNKKVMEDVRKGGVDSKLKSAVEIAYEKARRAFLPPYDQHAEKASQVYDSQEVAGEDAWMYFSYMVRSCLKDDATDWKEALLKNKFSKSTMALLDTLDETKKGFKYHLKTVILVNFLIRFHNRASRQFIAGKVGEMGKILDLPEQVTNRFIALFMTPSHDRGSDGFATSKQLKDKRIIYTLVLYVLAHGKDMKVGCINALCEDLRLDRKDAMNFYREAGFKCVKDSKTNMISVSLSVPLTFPPPRRGKK